MRRDLPVAWGLEGRKTIELNPSGDPAMPGPTTVFAVLMLVNALRLPVSTVEGGATIAEQAGLHPAAVACAGVDAGGALTMFLNFESDSDRWAQVKSLQATIDTSIEAIGSLQERLEFNPGDDEVRDALAAARAELRAAKSELWTAQVQLADAAAGWLGQDARALMRACVNAQQSGLPPEFGALALDELGLHQLRLALIQERRAERRGEPTPDGARDLLQAARSDRAVIAARAELSVNLPGVRAAWDQAR